MNRPMKDMERTVSDIVVDEITKNDIITIASLKNITFKDKSFAKEHITIQKINIKTSYEVEINDIDGKIHHLFFEIKTYNK